MSDDAASRIGNILLGLLFALLGLVLLGIAAGLALDRHEFLARAQTADGVVSRLNAGGAHPEIAFTTGAGEKISYPQGGFISIHRPGQTVRVHYLPEWPSGSAVIDDPGALWGVPVVMGGMGLIFGIAGVSRVVRRSRGAGGSQQRR
ncbi:DUF3592 domain-containing protein [Xanthomonas sp. 1678]|uniref:DUF3592 domain-containing protein n=1 Tax=Xanthomonas sp. 1678 TaxID=3158788 RepID=UPI002861F8C3|nr:hypothetical protein [Xanthomonas translucens]